MNNLLQYYDKQLSQTDTMKLLHNLLKDEITKQEKHDNITANYNNQ